jgi:DNA-binding protein
MQRRRIIPLAAMEKIIKQTTNARVSEDAKTALAEILEKEAAKISKDAHKYTLHAGRRTVKAEDIKLAKQSTA